VTKKGKGEMWWAVIPENTVGRKIQNKNSGPALLWGGERSAKKEGLRIGVFLNVRV